MSVLRWWLPCILRVYVHFSLFCCTELLHLCCRDSNLRKRIRSERNERMTQQVQEMKRKQQAAESWQQLKRSILQPLTIGIGVGVLLLGGAIAYSYFTNWVWVTGSVVIWTDLLVTGINQVTLPGSGLVKLKLFGSWILVLDSCDQVLSLYIYIYMQIAVWRC